jgi:capsular polysaccharide biosynthesis protein
MSEPDDFDVDLGAYVRAVRRLWWLVVLLAVVGALAGLGVTRIATPTYSATSAVYLGQPTDANGNAISGLPSNPRAAQQIVNGADVLHEAVKQLHGEIKLGALRHDATVTTPTTTAKSTTAPNNIAAITVTSRSAKKSADAANALAQILVERLSAFSDAKIALLEQQISAGQAQLTATNARLATAQRQLAAGGPGGTTAATYLAVVQSASTEQQALQTTLQNDKLSLLVARNVETPAVITAAVATGSAKNASSAKTSMAGGMVAGIVVALVIAAFTTRRRKPEPVAA